jgi:hypothetical protein
MIPTFIRAYEASAAINPYRIIAFSDAANSSKIATAASATAALIGTTGKVGGAIGAMVDVHRGGLNPVQLGGTVAAGDPLTANAAGKAIKATIAGQRIIGSAEQPGIADDIIDYFSAPGVLGGA